MIPRRHRESHKSGRTGWLRAAVLGSNDAIVSVSSLMIGIGAADASKQTILIAGAAGLVAGSMSMAVGEFVSVSAQRDSEQADVARETEELATSTTRSRIGPDRGLAFQDHWWSWSLSRSLSWSLSRPRSWSSRRLSTQRSRSQCCDGRQLRVSLAAVV
jgi:hypothetical protein